MLAIAVQPVELPKVLVKQSAVQTYKHASTHTVRLFGFAIPIEFKVYCIDFSYSSADIVENAYPFGVGGLLEGTRSLVLVHGFKSELCTSLPSAVSVYLNVLIWEQRDVCGYLRGDVIP